MYFDNWLIFDIIFDETGTNTVIFVKKFTNEIQEFR